MLNVDFSNRAYVYREKTGLKAINDIDFPDIGSLLFMDDKKTKLINNFTNFIENKPFNHVLLSGAKGCGKSSLAKAIFGLFDELVIIEIFKKDLTMLPYIIDKIRELNKHFVIFIDDLSFDGITDEFMELKSTLEGSLELPAKNVMFVVTSNYKNLIKQTRLEADGLGRDLNYNDINEQELSLKDRFGITMYFYNYSLDDYYEFVKFYFQDIDVDEKILLQKAFEFASLKASRSPRTAKQFYQDYAGKF